MPLQTHMAIRGDLKVQSRLTQWASRAGNTIPAMKAIEVMLEEKERDLFESDGASGRHGGWDELKDSTKEQKEASGMHPEILRATDYLFASLTDGDDEFAIRDIGPGFLRFGTSLPYAAIQASGFTSRAGNHVPARRPIDWTQTDRAEVLAIISEWITGMKAAGKRFRVRIRPSMRTTRF